MLVSKNNIKIILLLIFILVTHQISKSSPNNYIAYGLVAAGFYLVYAEIKVEEFVYVPEDDGIVSSQTSRIEEPVTEPVNEPVNEQVDEQIQQAELLEDARTKELQELKNSLIDEKEEDKPCDCNTFQEVSKKTQGSREEGLLNHEAQDVVT